VRTLSATLTIGVLTLGVAGNGENPALRDDRWPSERATAWYAAEPWRVGTNYIPSTAINQLEMWDASSFDLARIDEELGWAERAGLNTLRVFLHDLLWDSDPAGFRARIEAFLQTADRHGMKCIFVLFDSCWDPRPALGVQRAPRPGVHNSGWVQSPGAKALTDPGERQRLERYVRGVVKSFASDPRVLAWDVWNEPDSTNDFAYGNAEPPNKIELVAELLPVVFQWAKAEAPTQPLTSALWGGGDWSSDEHLSPIARIQIRGSDVISLHNYGTPDDLDRRLTWLESYGRPLLLTEFMARPISTIGEALPIAKRHRAAALTWGLVSGKTQTIFPWSSWTTPPPAGAEPWFQDILRPDGLPYDADEIAVLQLARSNRDSGSSRR
jgi:hypothetical protein